MVTTQRSTAQHVSACIGGRRLVDSVSRNASAANKKQTPGSCQQLLTQSACAGVPQPAGASSLATWSWRSKSNSDGMPQRAARRTCNSDLLLLLLWGICWFLELLLVVAGGCSAELLPAPQQYAACAEAVGGW